MISRLKVGIIADTHDNIPAIDKAVKVFNARRVGMVIHAGDWCAPFALARFSKLKARLVGIFGNVDGERPGLAARAAEIDADLHGDFAEVEMGRVRIAVIHGKDEKMVNVLASGGAFQVVVRGHAHRSEVKRIGSTLVVNPGEACGYLTGKRTVAILETPSLSVEIVDLK